MALVRVPVHRGLCGGGDAGEQGVRRVAVRGGVVGQGSDGMRVGMGMESGKAEGRRRHCVFEIGWAAVINEAPANRISIRGHT